MDTSANPTNTMVESSALLTPAAMMFYPVDDLLRATAAQVRTTLGTGDIVNELPAASTQPIVLMGSTAQSLITALAGVGHRREPVWVMYLGRDLAEIRAIDQAIDELHAHVDALVVIADADTAALAIDTWLRLRHDAPGRAFADLRDGQQRACRVATLSVMELPAQPPLTTRERADGNVQANATAVTSEFAQSCKDLAKAVQGEITLNLADDTDLGSYFAQVADKISHLVAAKKLPSMTTVLSSSAGAAAAIAELQSLVTVARSEQAQQNQLLRAAELSVAAAQSARVAELSRTGFAAKIGRKKRLVELSQRWSTSVQQLIDALIGVITPQVRIRVAQAWQQQLEAQLPRLQETEAAEASLRTAQALSSWWQSSSKAAAELRPAFVARESELSASWGSATPAIRQYLLCTDQPHAPGQHLRAPGSAAGVVLLTTQAVIAPRGVAMVLGMPAAAVTPADPLT